MSDTPLGMITGTCLTLDTGTTCTCTTRYCDPTLLDILSFTETDSQILGDTTLLLDMHARHRTVVQWT